MSEFCALKAKTYAFKLDNGNEVKKAKGTKMHSKKTLLLMTMLIHFLMIINY